MAHIDPDRVIKSVGRRVAELRRAAVLTQEELAEKAAVSIKYVQRVEAGRENLTIKSLVHLANFLGAPPIHLFTPPLTRRPGPGRPKKKPLPER